MENCSQKKIIRNKYLIYFTNVRFSTLSFNKSVYKRKKKKQLGKLEVEKNLSNVD